MNINDLIGEWITFRSKLAALDGVKASTLKNQLQICRTLRREFGATDVAALTKGDVTLFIAGRLQRCAPVTVDAEMAVFRQILKWGKEEKHVTEIPELPGVMVPNIDPPLPADDDYTWYLKTMPPRHADPLQFMCLTGLAPHELERLQVRDRDPVTGDVLIGHRKDFFVKCAARKRSVPINHAAAVIWTTWAVARTSVDPVFPGRDALQKAMRRHFLSHLETGDAPPGADGLTPKMMRKWFASKVALEHAEHVLQKLLGHAPGSPITRKHYVRSQDADLRAAVDGLA